MNPMLNAQLLDDFYAHTRSLAQNQLLPVLLETGADFVQLLDRYEQQSQYFLQQLHEPRDTIRYWTEHILFREQLLQNLGQWVPVQRRFVLSQELNGYLSAFEAFEKNLPASWYAVQQPERFLAKAGDSLFVRLLKRSKKAGFAIYCWPVHAANVVRRLVGGRPLEIKPWMQQIPIKKIAKGVYRNNLLQNTMEVWEENMQDVTMMAWDLWQLDDELYQELTRIREKGQDVDLALNALQQKLKDRLDALRHKHRRQQQALKGRFDAVCHEQDVHFQKLLEVGGTLEFRRSAFTRRRLQRLFRQWQRLGARRLNRRHNTLFALADDWRFNQELYILREQAQRTQTMYSLRLKSHIGILQGKLDPVQACLEQLQDALSPQAETVAKLLQAQKYQASRYLQTELIPAFMQGLAELNFPLLTEDVDRRFTQSLTNLKNARVLISGFDPALAYGDHSMVSVLPADLIDYEFLQPLLARTSQLKTYSMGVLDELCREVNDLGRIVVFGLETALVLLEQGGDQEQALKDARSGVQRALENFKSIRTKLEHLGQKLEGDFTNQNQEFGKGVLALRDNTRVNALKYRISKARALKRGQKVRKEFVVGLKELYVRSKARIRLLRRQSDSMLNTWRGRLGLQVIAGHMRSEVSDFLVDEDTVSRNLPFIYRRLFQAEPLKDPLFYFSRKQEFHQLGQALEKWQRGLFSAVLLTGEKGSGATSLVQMFVRQHIQQKPGVYALAPSKRILTDEDFLTLLGQSLRAEPFQSFQDFYAWAEQQEPLVVVVDKLQLFYLRQPGGFNLLKRMFEMMSHTSRKIFWICTSTLYASRYLDKAISLYSYFPCVITMRSLTLDDITEVILLRHRASGFQLVFRPSAGVYADRRFRQKDPVSQQQYLQTLYFENLNRLTQSNIAFALFLWLRSASLTSDNKISLMPLDELDFSFLNLLGGNDVFTLHAIILHEVLDAFMLAQVLQISRRQARLLLMRLTDKGLVQEDVSLYRIHPLLYRQVIELLKDRNFIH